LDRIQDMIHESRFKQMRKRRFVDLKSFLQRGKFMDADAEGDYDDLGQSTSEAAETLQRELLEYFNNRFGKDRISVNITAAETMTPPAGDRNKATVSASYRYENGHIINLEIANVSEEETFDGDFDEYEESDRIYTLRDLGRADEKIYEVIMHELLHMQQFLKYSKGNPTNKKFDEFIASYGKTGNDLGEDYFFFDEEGSERETFALQLALELVDSYGRDLALKFLTQKHPDLGTLRGSSASFRSFLKHNVNFARPEFYDLLKRARQYVKLMD
jgi:hypothetical protein